MLHAEASGCKCFSYSLYIVTFSSLLWQTKNFVVFVQNKFQISNDFICLFKTPNKKYFLIWQKEHQLKNTFFLNTLILDEVCACLTRGFAVYVTPIHITLNKHIIFYVFRFVLHSDWIWTVLILFVERPFFGFFLFLQ